MMRSILLFTLLSSASFAQPSKISDKEIVLLAMVGTYVNGFKEFDTSTQINGRSISIAIYFDASTQDRARAETLATRFKTQVPRLLERSGLGEVEISVNVYSEDRAKGY